MNAWFAARSDSEKVLLTVGALTVAAALYFLLVLDPMSQANARLATRLAAARDLGAHLTEVAAEAESLGGQAPSRARLAPNASLLAVVTASAKVADVQPHARKMAPVGARALSLYLEDIPYTKLAAWLVSLDEQAGVEVERANIEAKAPGVVRADLTLKGR